jgi:predicted metal-dependent phosphoesterase TrpH
VDGGVGVTFFDPSLHFVNDCAVLEHINTPADRRLFTICLQADTWLVTKTRNLRPNLFVMDAMSRADLHCHSSASEVSRLGVQRAMGLPECATPPEEVYALAKRRGMDFVTITDHDTIDGVLQIADRSDVFVSEELTAHFRGEPQAVHVLCYGIAPDHHEWLQTHSHDVERCAEYMHERGIVCALAHPYYTVAAQLTPRHRRRLVELFAIWEVRNGARARELNRPAAIYIATHDGIGIGGSDDHAGVDIGRTFTETPPARTTAEYLDHLRAGRTRPRGEQGGAAKWAHAAIALAARSLGGGHELGTGQGMAPDPRTVMRMAERLLREGDARHGATGNDLTPDDARQLLRAWLAAVDLREDELIEHMQAQEFSHADLYRRACRAHERKLGRAVAEVADAIEQGGASTSPRPPPRCSRAASPRSPTARRRRSSARRRRSSTRARARRRAWR